MTEQEIAYFCDLFIRNGYVLNFYDRNSLVACLSVSFFIIYGDICANIYM